MRIWLPILGAAAALAAAGMIVSATRAQTVKQTVKTAPAPVSAAGSAHDFTLTRIDGKPLPLGAYKGKVVLLVNTASFCGFTQQYEGLQKLQTAMAPRGFTVVGVPSGDFMSQEYDDNGKIKEFCETKFGISFPMSEKAVVKGPNAIPVYRWAKTQVRTENEPKWNFHKFLIGKDGKVIAGFGSNVEPTSPQLKAAIEAALKA
ncbi:MAG: glutathione peroxidase [Sandaracinobacteroides sp.]